MVAVHPEFCELLPLWPDGAAGPCAVVLDFLDECGVVGVGLEEEALADELRADDFLLVVELALALVEDQLARLLRPLELLLDGLRVLWFVLLLLAVSSQVGIDTNQDLGSQVDVRIDLFRIAEDLREDGEAQLLDGLYLAKLVFDSGGIQQVFEDADV